MAKLLLKVVLIAIVVALLLWNWVWSKTATVPLLSSLSSTVIYAIAGIVLLIFVIVHFSTKQRRVR
jgi:hypothetical protein